MAIALAPQGCALWVSQVRRGQGREYPITASSPSRLTPGARSRSRLGKTFIGLKLILHWAHEDISTAVPEIPTMLRLGVIAVVLVTATVASLRKTRQDPAEEESASAP